MSILSTNTRLIKVGQDYSAGSGISIDDHVISVTGEFGKTYSAGNNIDIYKQGEQLYISSKDWSEDIANASSNAYNEAIAQIPVPFDPSFISGQVDNKLDTTAFTAWQNGQYTTDLQTIEGQISNKYDTSSFAEVSGSFQPSGDYAKRDFVLSSIESSTSGKLDVSSFASVSSDFLTNEDLNNYYTKDETSGKEELANAFANIPTGDVDVNNYVQNNSATIDETVTTYQTNSGYYQPSGNYIPYTAVDSVFPAFETNSGLEIKTNTVAGYLSNTYINESHISLSYIDSNLHINNRSVLSNDSLDFKTNSDSAYVDREKIHTWDSASNYIQNISGTFNEVSTTVQSNSAQWAEGGTTYTSPIGTISIYGDTLEGTTSAITGSIITNVVDNGETFNYTNLSGLPNYPYSEYLVELPKNWSTSITCVYGDWTQSYQVDIPSNEIFSVPPVSAELPLTRIGTFGTISAIKDSRQVVELALKSELPTYEYDNTNKISAINGSALAGGGDVPTGTMNVTGLEYNAVNEISAYNGSAIAQYGAEKQWLVHDDTLCHLSNSAQYALGVNVSALQRLMGIDETVLFTSSWNDKLWNVNLSEPISSFKKIRMYVTRGDGSNEPKSYEYETSLLSPYLTLEVDTILTNEIYKYFTLCRLSGSTYTELSARLLGYPNTLDSWNNTNSWCHPIKIVGIGRKE